MAGDHCLWKETTHKYQEGVLQVYPVATMHFGCIQKLLCACLQLKRETAPQFVGD
jgi:hypothetical protein